jgi:hypothetical protein
MTESIQACPLFIPCQAFDPISIWNYTKRNDLTAVVARADRTERGSQAAFGLRQLARRLFCVFMSSHDSQKQFNLIKH